MPFEMLKIAHDEGIHVEYWDFELPLEGIYLTIPGLPPVIGIANRLFEFSPRFRCVLAEELGHHFTTVGDILPKKYFHYRDRLTVSQAEYRALKWAAEYLMPTEALEAALATGIRACWELAEHFSVTEQMVEFRLRLLEG